MNTPPPAFMCRLYGETIMTPTELRSELQSADMSQSELARRLGVAVHTVQRWVAGTRGISRWVEPHIREQIKIYRSERGDSKNQSGKA